MNRKSLENKSTRMLIKMAQRYAGVTIPSGDREAAILALLLNQGQKALGTAVSMLCGASGNKISGEVCRHPWPRPRSPDAGLRLSVQPVTKITEHRFDLYQKALDLSEGDHPDLPGSR